MINRASVGNVTGGYLHQLTEQKVLQGFFHTVSGVWNSQITEVVQVGGRCYYYYFFFSFRFFFFVVVFKSPRAVWWHQGCLAIYLTLVPF